MIQIEDTIVSLDLIEKKFVCDLSTCKGICCVEGDCGAPLEEEELALLEEVLPIVWDDLSPEAKAIIISQGTYYYDREGEPVTSIVHGADCVFTCYDGDGMCKCAIEKAFREGRTSFYKPISCHLYPVRLGKYDAFTAVNYHRWGVCRAAVVLGEKLGKPLYEFLKEPLIRKFGEEWYAQLDYAAKNWDNRPESIK